MPFPRLLFIFLAILLAALPGQAAAPFTKGDTVRLTKSETLLFKGKNFLGAPKGQDFTVLQQEAGKGIVYVAYYKEDGSLIAVTLPLDALEAAPVDPWADVLHGVEAFRDRRIDETKRLFARASQSPEQKALVATLSPKLNAALATARAPGPAFVTALKGLRDLAEELAKQGQLCLALPLDEGTDWLVGQLPDAPPSKLDRAEVSKQVAISNRAVVRSRQSIAVHRLMEAQKIIDEGLEAEPERSELKVAQKKVKKDIDEATERYKNADSMRKFYKGEVHALTALEIGLKICVDHPQLIALRKEMSGAFEERTAPPITPAFLAAAKVSTSRAALEEGHHLYTTRCTECHDLELIDSRGNSGWQKAVASMSRRANIDETQQARILDYLAAAQNTVEAAESK